ncbi:hypothetical protein Snov_1316 [Ancylobacter novellus DSM 506]|uniref:Uncharacterized protein n=1 Tax=Ancylobacter novellus (strain ATCC 8093 / DSM 506 / JCM 20403 / CCM 1077 / IAM 12100 / NBRC 12443 / NCIMB 10456) TaxID=639283 RepID=D7A8F3_ANCN5|nr:hypothetical protein Snov_1316 [Ancylobacter novellus DSM 506]
MDRMHVSDHEIEDVDQEWAKEMYFQLLRGGGAPA